MLLLWETDMTSVLRNHHDWLMRSQCEGSEKLTEFSRTLCVFAWLDVLQRRCSFHPCPHQISRPPIAHIKTENKTFSNNLTFSVSVIITKPLLPLCFHAAEKRSSDFLIKTAPRLYKPKCNLWLQRCAENCKTLDYDFKAP